MLVLVPKANNKIFLLIKYKWIINIFLYSSPWMFHYIISSSIFYYFYLKFVSVCTLRKCMLLQGEKGKKKKVFRRWLQIEMDERYINNGNSFYSPVSDHRCILLRILVAMGMDSFEVERCCRGLWCERRDLETQSRWFLYTLIQPLLSYMSTPSVQGFVTR